MATLHTRIILDDVEDAAPANGLRRSLGGASGPSSAQRRADGSHPLPTAGGEAIAVLPPSHERRRDRAFEAGPDGLEFLVFGPHHRGDGEASTIRGSPDAAPDFGARPGADGR